MERVLHAVASEAYVYAFVIVFCLGVLLYSFWVTYLAPDRPFVRKVSFSLFASSAGMFFVRCYAAVVELGLEGEAVVPSRYARHAHVLLHDDNPLAFWLTAAFDSAAFGLLVMITLVIMIVEVTKHDVSAAARVANRYRTATTAQASHGQAGRVEIWPFMLLFGALEIAALAWMASSFHQRGKAQSQIRAAMASVSREKSAVESYLHDQDRLPADGRAAGLSMSRSVQHEHISLVKVEKDHVLLTFNETTADAHLRGRHLALLAVLRGHTVVWYCFSRDIDERYLPDGCLGGG